MTVKMMVRVVLVVRNRCWNGPNLVDDGNWWEIKGLGAKLVGEGAWDWCATGAVHRRI